MTDPAPAPDQVITDDELRAEMERDPNLLHRLRADEECERDALKKRYVYGGYWEVVASAIYTERREILRPRKDSNSVEQTRSTDLAEARHILSAIATYKAIQEGAPALHRRPADAPPVDARAK